MSRRTRIWLGAGVLVVALQVAVSFAVPHHGQVRLFGFSVAGSYLQTAYGDLTQALAVGLAGALMLGNAVRTQGRVRLFWSLTAIGFAFWFADCAIWAFYEVFARTEVPHLTIGDTFLFLHLVPMVAALGVRPESRVDPVSRQRTWIDFAILLTYWLYFYALLVMPFEFIKPDLPTYNFNYDLVDKIGHWVLVTALFFAMLRARGPWRRFYMYFTIVSICYAVFSDIANLAIDVNGYYTGNPYDILLIAVEFGFVYLAMLGRWIPKDAATFDLDATPEAGKSRWQIPTLIGTAATLSTPAIGMVLIRSFPQMDPSVRQFRLLITLVAVVLLVSFVFFKQILLQSDLVHSLSSVSQAYSDLKNVQDQLVQSEKLASMGRLLAGTAHEINNPLTAILGYSDLISSDTAADAQSRSMAEKIAHQARRTKLLVEDLLKFSQQAPTQRSVNSVQVLLSNAIKIAVFETGGGINVEFNPGTELPLVEVDTGQILQVFVHLIRNASDAMRESSSRVLRISTRSGNGQVKIEFADSGPGVRDPDLVFDPFYTTKSPGKGVGLGLSACYGIVQKHGGQITCHNRPHGGAIFTVTLPAAEQPQTQNV